MELGAHLPLIGFDGTPVAPAVLRDYVDTAREGGFAAIGSNDHLEFGLPWFDGIVALSSIVERAGAMTLATTVALPVVRGAVPMARAASALQALSGGRFVLGVGAGSSAADYDAVGVPFDERWPRFEAAVRRLRAELADGPAEVPIWIGSWGSEAGLRRVARSADGWLASAYNTTPERIMAGRDTLRLALREAGRVETDLPVSLASSWTYVTDSADEAEARLASLAATFHRDPADLAGQVLVGDAESCAATLRRYADAGVDTVFIWPLGDPVAQLQRFVEQVVPLVHPAS